MPILVMAVVAFIVFNILLFLMLSAALREKDYYRDHKDEYPAEPKQPAETIETDQIKFVERGGEARWHIAG